MMVTPRVRASLGRREMEIVERAIGRTPQPGRRALEARMMDGGIDAVLRDPGLDEALLVGGPGLSDPPLPFLFYVLVVRSLAASRLDDARVSDYVASLLVEACEGEMAWRLDATSEPLHYLADIMIEVERGREGAREHLGNFALWFAGVFPDRVETRRQRRGAPGLAYYDAMGRAGFRSAAQRWDVQARGIRPVLDTLAEHFRVVREALNRISDRVFFPGAGPDPVERLLRQATQGRRPTG